nr:helix-turn-helix transcriptional regulator [Lacticaseibacillus paracasei]
MHPFRKIPAMLSSSNTTWIRYLLEGVLNLEENVELKRLGKFFKNFRVGRDLTLEEATGENWSTTTLSRFENGVSDISNEKAIGLIHQIAIEPQDFLLFPEASGAFPMHLQPLIQTNDINALTKRRAAFFAENQKTTSMTKLAAVLFDAGIHWPEAKYHFDAEAEQIIADRLVIPENLTPFEWEIQEAIMAPASHELLMLLWNRTDRMQHNLRKEERGTILVKLWLGALMDRDVEFLDAVRSDLTSEMHKYGDLETYTEWQEVWHFTQLLEQWVLSQSVAHEKQIDDMITDTQSMGDISQAKYFNLIFARTRQGQPHHNLKLKDVDPMPIVRRKTAGGVIVGRRNYLGLHLNDIVLDRSKSTLRRFEKGETQLSFGSLVQLSEQMAVLVPTLLGSMNVTLQGQNRNITLWFSWYDIVSLRARGKDIESAQEVIDRTMDVMKDVSEKIREGQLFVLQRTAMEAGFKKFDEDAQRKVAPKLLKQLLKSNHWGIFEYLILRYLCPLLAFDELTLLFQQVQRVLSKQPGFFGRPYAYGAMSLAFVCAAKAKSSDEAVNFLHSLSWINNIDEADGSRWMAIGSKQTALDLIQRTDESRTAVKQFITRCQDTGHFKVLDDLKAHWGDLVPNDYFKI